MSQRVEHDASSTGDSANTQLEASSASSSSKQADVVAEDWVSRSGLEVRLINLVGTIDLKTKLDLKTIALQARNAEYNPRRFSAVIMRFRDPKATCLIFSTGKVVITGTRSEQECRLSARKVARIIQKLNFPARFTNFKLQNFVATSDVRFPIRLEGLVHDHNRFSTYEPELFPGLIYHLVEPKVCLLVFVSGKIVLTGAKSMGQIHEAMEKMYPVLVEYRKNITAPAMEQPKSEKQAKKRPRTQQQSSMLV